MSFDSKAYLLQRHKSEMRRLRAEAIASLGGACECCGIDEPKFLTVDHFGLRGSKQTDTEYRRLSRLGWPKDEVRILCFNCNIARQHYGGVCPHKLPRE